MFEDNNLIIDTLLTDIDEVFFGMNSDSDDLLNMIERIN